MLQITPEATAHLMQVRKDRGIDANLGVRFVNNAGRVGLTFAQKPETGDRVIEAAGVAVFVSKDALAVLDQSVIDTRAEAGKTALVIRRRTRPDSTEAGGQ